MKKLFLLAIIGLSFALQTSAQFYPDGRPIHPKHRYNSGDVEMSNTYYGLRLGLGLSTVNSDSKALDGNKVQAGLNVGFAIGTQLSPAAPVFIESGLYYTEKGGKSEYEGKNFTYYLNYLELPILVKYRYFATDEFSVEPFFGGYLSCGVGGKIKNYGDRKAFSSFKDNYFGRFDGGLKLGVGLSFQMMYFDLNYDFGLANIGQDDFDDTNNGCFYINFGVNF